MTILYQDSSLGKKIRISHGDILETFDISKD